MSNGGRNVSNGGRKERVAVVGGGVAGLVTAFLLRDSHEVTLFEAGERLGGHTHTEYVELPDGGRQYVDMGFIVFNRKTYPNFVALLELLGVAAQDSDMSFGVRDESTGLEWNATDLDSTFAQRRNMFSPSFIRMLLQILRFHKEARELLHGADPELTLGEFVRKRGYSDRFVRQFLMPMTSALWSSDLSTVERFPAVHFARFFENHGMLTVNDRPQWLTVAGGSETYVRAIEAQLTDARTSAPVTRVERKGDRVEVTVEGLAPESFDKCVIAAHSDQALRVLASPTAAEREVLESIPYTPNQVTLHTDATMLPRIEKAKAAWNYHLPVDERSVPTVTYWMNRLQRIAAPESLCVTLNRGHEIDRAKVHQELTLSHPVFTPQGVVNQARQDELNGVGGVYFCGAYWGWGFHEDAVKSALAVTRHFGQDRIA